MIRHLGDTVYQPNHRYHRMNDSCSTVNWCSTMCYTSAVYIVRRSFGHWLYCYAIRQKNLTWPKSWVWSANTA